MNLCDLSKMEVNFANFDTRLLLRLVVWGGHSCKEVSPKVVVRSNYEFLRRHSARFAESSSQNFTSYLWLV